MKSTSPNLMRSPIDPSASAVRPVWRTAQTALPFLHWRSAPTVVNAGLPGTKPHSSRTGSLIVEMVVCCILLGVVSLVLVPTMHAVGQQRKAIRFQSMARIELNNIHQKLLHGALTFSTDQSDLPQSSFSHAFAVEYPDATLSSEPLEISQNAGVSDTLPDNGAIQELTAIRLHIEAPSQLHRPPHRCSVVVWLSEEDLAEEMPEVEAVPTETTPTEGAAS